MIIKHIFSVFLLSTNALAHHPMGYEPRLTNPQIPNLSFETLYNLTNTFMQTYMYPNNIPEAQKINSTFFSSDVLGRVDATRDFQGRELNTEYIFGLFANIALNPDSFTILGYPVNYTLTHFAANQNIVSFAAVVFYNITALNALVPQELDFWITFNDQGQISQYDGTFRYLQWQIASLITGLQTSLGLNTTTAVESLLQQKLAQSICSTAQTYCNGSNTQYASLSACENHLINDTRLGEAWEWGMDTVSCRMIHQNMVPLRPDVHCAHIGPSGGGMCVDDRTYVGNVLEPYFVNAPFVPYGKGNSTL